MQDEERDFSEAPLQDGTGAGFVNAHTHMYSGLAIFDMPAPQPAPTNFSEILERVWWRLDRALDEDSLRASAELYVAQSLVAGTSALIDHHESPNFIEGSLDVLADACEDLGMFALLCYGVTERNGGAEEARLGLAENERFIRACSQRGAAARVQPAVGLHASFTVSDDTIRAAAALASDHNVRLHLHVAEDPVDVADARQRGYGGVIDRLDKLGALLPGSILAHGVHLSRDEVAMASERCCWFIQNPRSNRVNGVGYPAHLGSAERVALGTDGFPAHMAPEFDTLLMEAGASGLPEELASAAGRLRGSGTLALELFEALAQAPRAPVRPSGEQMEQITRTAKSEATRLWQRMQLL